MQQVSEPIGADRRPAKPGALLPVLYIAGRGRSGSTVLDTLLGQVDGVFSGGELRLWNRRWRENARCGCGQPVRDCDLWRRVLGRAYGDEAGIARAAAVHERGARQSLIGLMLLPGGEAILRVRFRTYLANLARLYDAIGEETGCAVISDSSKSPLYAVFLNALPRVRLHLVHLVRDPRAVAYSWLRQRASTEGTDDPLYRRRLGPVRSTLLWDLVNVATARLERDLPGRFTLLRYEDFVRSPEATLVRLLQGVGLAGAELPLTGTAEAVVAPTHTVSGNPRRFQQGRIVLKPDDEWTGTMPASARRMVTAVAWPWLGRYGYRGDG